MTRTPRLSKKIRHKIFTSFVDDQNAVDTTITIGRDFFHQQDRWEKWHQSFHITVLRYYRHYREKIRDHGQAQYPRLGGEIEVNLVYFGAHHRRKKDEELRVKKLLGITTGKPVRAKKTKAKKYFEMPVLGILQRGGPVILLPVVSRARPFLELMLQKIVEKGSIVYTDGEKGLGEIKMLGFTHRAVNHSKHYVDENGWHINGIESVFNQMKDKMKKRFKGLPKSTLGLHIKEREFRYNHRTDLQKALQAILK